VLKIVAPFLPAKTTSLYATALTYLAMRNVSPEEAAKVIGIFGGVRSCATQMRRLRADAPKQPPVENLKTGDVSQAIQSPNLPQFSASRLYLVVCERLDDGGTIVHGFIEDRLIVAQAAMHMRSEKT
jgi:hypothetical protein